MKPLFDNAQAFEEVWHVADYENPPFIQAWGILPGEHNWETADARARAHVLARANEGSAYHIEALAYVAFASGPVHEVTGIDATPQHIT